MSLNAQKTREFSPNVLRRIKLRTRLFVTFLIISLVPVITIGIFSYHAYTQSMNEKVKQAAFMIRYNGCTALRTEGKSHVPYHLSRVIFHLPSPHSHFSPFFRRFLRKIS